jgi:UTP--glucose-1-phosphate uridylyltransferase
MGSIKTAVIPAAGLGTRLLPATKTIPKELIPMLARPSIEYVMEEAVDAGITEFIVIVGDNGELIEDYFTPPTGYENLRAHLNARFDGLNHILSKARVRYVQQDEPKGLGHAVFCAQDYIEEDYFVVLLPDDIIVQDPPCLANLIDVSVKLNGGALAVIQVPRRKVSSYGIVRAEATDLPNTHQIRGLVEKPSPDKAPSNLAIVGRYVLPTSIFPYLRDAAPGAGGEIQLTDAIARLLDNHGIYACEVTGERHDVGNKLGLAKAWMRFALDDPEVGAAFREYAASLLVD